MQGQNAKLDKASFKKLLKASIKQLYGIIGGAFDFDIVSYDEGTATATIQVDQQ